MSSVSMILNDCGKKINEQDITPQNLNQWLRSFGGYVDGDLLVWGSIKPYGYSFQGKFTDQATIEQYFNNGYAVVLNVNNGGHWVLMTGISGSQYLVNDAGYDKTGYYKTEVVNSGVWLKPNDCAKQLETFLQ